MEFRLYTFEDKKQAFKYLYETPAIAIFPSLNFWKTLSLLILFLRLIVPAFIFFHPLLVFLVFSFLDLIDYGPFKTTKMREKEYQRIDKPLDLYSQFFIMLFGLGTEYSLIFLFLFLYRLAGTIGFLVTNKHLFLLIFPNFIEAIFLAYVISLYFTFNFSQALGALVILKIIQEIFLHALHIPSAIFEINIRKKLVQIQIS